MANLTYVGDGNTYLNGVPAADFETDDEETIAHALQSGLYEVAADGESPKRKKKSEPVPEETTVSATDESAPAPAE